jgi:hypothetical protein
MRSPFSKVVKSLAAAAVVAVGVTAGGLTSVSATMKKSVAANPPFLVANLCGTSGSGANDTQPCNAAIETAINNGRKEMSGGPPLPSNFSLSAYDALNNDQQNFVMANVERTVRGLPPVAGLTAQLNLVALNAANDRADPSVQLPYGLRGGGQAYQYGSNLAQGTANSMGADYYWMYDDGLDSPNAGCTSGTPQPCWGHRNNILGDYSEAICPKGDAVNIVMGTAETTTTGYNPAVTQIFVEDCGPLPELDYTWAAAQKAVFGT